MGKVVLEEIGSGLVIFFREIRRGSGGWVIENIFI